MTYDVVANLYGGLGNQLFQYTAAVRALRLTGGTTFDLLILEGPDATIAEFLDLHPRVPTRVDRARWSEHASAQGPLKQVFVRSARVNEGRTKRLIIRHSSPFDVAEPIPHGALVKLEGFFQDPSWFKDDWSVVAGDLLARAPDGFADLVDERRTVVHLRRGDYVRAGWELSPTFYETALAHLPAGTREVTVVSDEPRFVPWFEPFAARAGLTLRLPDRLPASPVRSDFYTVAAANTVIASNSTFAWWASAVATHRDGSVGVWYPAPWIVSRWPMPAPDMGLPGWMCLPSALPEFE